MQNLHSPSTWGSETHLALRLEDHLLRLLAEMKRIEPSGTASERTSLQATIDDVQRLLRRFVF